MASIDIDLHPPREINNSLILPNNQVSERDMDAFWKLSLMLISVIFIAIYFSLTVIFALTALIILCQKAFMKNAFSIGQRFLAIFNLMVAVVLILRYSVRNNTGTSIGEWNAPMCRVYKTLYLIMSTNSNWSVVYLTYVRYLSIKSPIKVNLRKFLHRSYIWFMALTVISALFYFLLYHEITRAFTYRIKELQTDQCFSFSNFPVNEQLYKTAMMVPAAILPMIFVLVFNILLYKEFKQINIKRMLLKKEMHRRSNIISRIKNSLAECAFSVATNASAENETCAKESCNVPTKIASKSKTTSSDCSLLHDILSRVMKSRPVTPTLQPEEPNPTSGTNITDTDKRHSKEELLQKLQIEKIKLRRTTIAYDVLCRLQNIPIKNYPLIISERRKSRSISVEGVEIVIPPVINRQPSPVIESKKSVGNILIINTLFFILLFIPYCLWYIFANLINKADTSLEFKQITVGIVYVIECIGRISTFFIYIFFGSKIKAEGKRIKNKLFLYGTHNSL